MAANILNTHRKVSVAPMMDYTNKGDPADESTACAGREWRVPALSQLLEERARSTARL